MDLPAAEAELELYRLGLRTPLLHRQLEPRIAPVLDRVQALQLRHASRHTHVAEEILRYVQQLAQRARAHASVELGVSPRAALSLIEATRAAAWLAGRDFVTPDDVQELLAPCWAHRLLLTAEAELEGSTPTRLLGQIVSQVEVPTVVRDPLGGG
jgi:MoxR-like ATPase